MTDPADAPLVLRTDSANGVVTLTLNRRARFNPLSAAMIATLEAELDRLSADRHARVVVLAGAGRGFCAGHDLWVANSRMRSRRNFPGETVCQASCYNRVRPPP